MRVILNGGAGFIGSHIAEGPVEACEDVNELYDRSTEKRGNPADVSDRVRVLEGGAGCRFSTRTRFVRRTHRICCRPRRFRARSGSRGWRTCLP
jgi:nucleoside-diphosphate-sugar epimerase